MSKDFVQLAKYCRHFHIHHVHQIYELLPLTLSLTWCGHVSLCKLCHCIFVQHGDVGTLFSLIFRLRFVFDERMARPEFSIARIHFINIA